MTAIVLALNEAVNIERCVRSLGWCSQVIVVDSGSTDGTIELAEMAGAEVVHHPFEGFSAQRNWVMRSKAVREEWTLFVDADEWISGELAAEIRDALENKHAAGYAMRRRFIFQGRWIKYAGWYRTTWLTRLMPRDTIWQGDVSEKPVISGRVGRLGADLVDEDMKNLETWLSRHNSYSTLLARRRARLRQTRLSMRLAGAVGMKPKAAVPREVAKQVVFPSLPAPGLFRFFYMYIICGGFLMGRTGLRFCLLHSMQQMHVSMKIEESGRRCQRGDAASLRNDR